jgi:hypothetical protein
MQQHRVNLSSYQFRRSKCDGLIEVLNEGLYVMAEYSERTGLVKWQRVVLASQREQIEKWLGEHYPVQARAKEQPAAKRRVPAQPERGLARSASATKPASRS